MTLMGTVSSYSGLLVARFFLGVAEVCQERIYHLVFEADKVTRLGSFQEQRMSTNRSICSWNRDVC